MTRSLSYRNQSIDLKCKPMDWFLYDRDLRQEELKTCAYVFRVMWLCDKSCTINMIILRAPSQWEPCSGRALKQVDLSRCVEINQNTIGQHRRSMNIDVVSPKVTIGYFNRFSGLCRHDLLTNQLIRNSSKWTGFYMMATLAFIQTMISKLMNSAAVI